MTQQHLTKREVSKLPLIMQTVLFDPSCSQWLKDAIISAVNRDPCYCLTDAKVLFLALVEYHDEQIQYCSDHKGAVVVTP